MFPEYAFLPCRAAASIKKAVDAVNGGGKVEVQHLDLASLKWVALFCLAPSSARTWPASDSLLSQSPQLRDHLSWWQGGTSANHMPMP